MHENMYVQGTEVGFLVQNWEQTCKLYKRKHVQLQLCLSIRTISCSNSFKERQILKTSVV